MSPSSASMFFSRSSTASVSEFVPCIVVEGKRRTRQPAVRVRDCVSDQRALPVGEYAVQPLAAVRSRVDEGLEVAGDLSAFDPFDDRRRLLLEGRLLRTGDDAGRGKNNERTGEIPSSRA